MFKRAWEYILTVLRFYKGHISGWMLAIVAIGLQLAAAKVADDPKMASVVVRWSAWITTGAAVWAFFVAQYDAWRSERNRAEDAEKKLRPRIKIGVVQSQLWTMEEGRGSTGIGYYFSISNMSESETLDSVKAHLILLDPDDVKILPLPLHIRHQDYETTETLLHPRASVAFDLVTGPDHNTTSQKAVLIPCIVRGDRWPTNSMSLSMEKMYRLKVLVTARNCRAEDAEFEVWVESNFLRCAARRISGEEVL